jgi:hypothetical protein
VGVLRQTFEELLAKTDWALGERRLKISRSHAHQSVEDAASHRLATVAAWYILICRSP